ncbi:MAG: hypothetical protein IH989_08665 [Planctomycetes bacterium]|nr:hypothetical protein [Planctomycetota bacterium]
MAIRGVLESLDYAVIQGCEYMQFINPQGVKIDLLTGPLGELESKAKRRQDDRRIGPTPTAKLHAHRTDEAIGFQVDATEIRVNGMLSDGAAYDAVIRIPQAFTFLMMKLFAFRDRNREGEKDDARHHALDLYRTVAMLSEEEFERAMGMGAKHRSNPKVAEAGRIRQEYFGEPMGLGVLRIREHRLLIAEETVAPFLSALARILRFAQDA